MKTMIGLRSKFVILLLSLTFSGTGLVFASDGVLEISQACVSIGCFAGDEAGFPVQITAPGSYRLTSNLDVRGESSPQNVTAIDVVTGSLGATIDLNGFSILGPTSCPEFPPVCSPTGGGIGVDVSGDMVTVRNGRIRGMGNDGVRVTGTAGRVEDLHVEHCGDIGVQIAASGGGMAINNFIRFNGNHGIFAGPSGLILGNVLFQNGGWGVDGASNTAYGHNLFHANDSGHYDSGIQIDGNVCATALCP